MSGPISFNTGSTLQLKQLVYDSSHVLALGNSLETGFTAIENKVLLNLAKNVNADSSNSFTDSSANTCKSLSYSRGDIMVNNTSIDTPNLAIITKNINLPFTIYSYDASMGTNSYGGNPHTFTGKVSDLSSSIVWIPETVDISFIFSTNQLYYDQSSNWSVEIESQGSNNLKNMARAANSYLNARDASGNPFNPLSITETSFNYYYALANGGNGGTGPTDATSAFNYYFTTPNNSYTDFDAPPTVNTLSGNNPNSMYHLTYQANQGSGEEFGSWRFDLSLDTSPAVHYSPALTSDLPFGYNNGSSNLYLPSSFTEASFNAFFSNPLSVYDVCLNIIATSVSGGYYDASNLYSQSFNDTQSNKIFSIDDTNLTNNAPYMNAGYPSQLMNVTISNGDLSITPTGPNTFTRGQESEALDGSHYTVSGDIKLQINAANNRILATNTPTEFSGVSSFVFYNTSEASANLPTYAPNHIYGNTSIATNYKTSDSVQVSTQQILNGYVAGAGYGGYSYSPALAYKSDATSKTVLYTGESIPNGSLTYNVSGTVPNNVAQLIVVNSIKGLVDPSSAVLYRLTKTQSGANGMTVNVNDNDNMVTPAGPQFVTLPNGKNVPFLNPTIQVQNLTLAHLPYEQYRGLFLPKLLSDLCGNGLGPIDISSTDISGSSCALHIGYLNDISGSYTISAGNDATDNVITSSNNLKYNYGAITGLNGSAVTKNNLKTQKPSYNVDFAYYTSTTIGNSSFDDTMVFKFNTTDFQSSSTTSFTSVSGDNYLVCVTGYSDANGSYWVQLPIGHYTNVFIKTPVLNIDASDNLLTPLNGTLTFTQGALEGLKFSLQGSIDPSANYTDVSNGWSYISRNDPSGITSASTWTGLECYDGTVSTFYVPDPSGGSSGTGTVSLQSVNSTNAAYLLTNPGYTLKLSNAVGPNVTILGKTFTDTTSVQNSTPVGTSVIGLYDLASPFDPTLIVNSDYTSISSGTDLSLSSVITYDASNNLTTFAIQDVSNSVTYTLTAPDVINRNFAIWRCPQDVYDVSVNIDTVDASPSPHVVQSQDTSNNSVLLVPGVGLYNTGSVIPAAGRYNFNISGDYIAIHMAHNVTTGNKYEVTNPIEITHDNGDLTTEYNGVTRSLTFDNYRGYTTNNNGVSTETQNYTINRTGSTISMNYASNGSQSNSSVSTPNYDMYKTSYPINPDFSNADVSGIAFRQIGLMFDISQSMLRVDQSPSFTIRAVGDPITIDYLYNDTSSTDLTNLISLGVSGGHTIPGATNKIIAERVKATKTNVSSPATYTASRASGQVNIWAANNNSPVNRGFLGDPGDPSSGLFTWNLSETVNISTLASNHSIGKNLLLSLDTSATYTSTTKSTYLVAPPPYFKLQGLESNSAGSFPFYLGPSGQNVSNPSGGFQAAGAYGTYYTFPNSEHGGNYTTVKNNNSPQLWFTSQYAGGYYSYVANSSPAGNVYEMIVHGNKVTITETTQGGSTTKTLYDGIFDNLSSFPVPGTVGGSTYDKTTVRYDLSYAQDLSSIGISAGNTQPIVTLEISGGFNLGRYDISLNPSNASDPYLYGVQPYSDASGNYALSLYRYSPKQVSNYLAIYGQGQLSSDRIIPYNANTREYKHVPLPSQTFGATPYSLQNALSQLTLSDISGGWISDASFNQGGSGPGEQLNFEIVALDTSGQNLLPRLFATSSPGNALSISGDFSYNDVNVNALYFTLPDIMNITSTDGAPVMRVLYNGSIVTSTLTAAQVALVPSPTTNASTALLPNQELVNFNIGTDPVTYDASGSMNVP